ncbi:MAG: GTP-binding protein, partial [Staphylococcus epidermidis]|nr:GTP-binding protein [Staphylococcus epidermidis]
NKIDKVEVEETARLLRHLERINSDANIQVGQFGELNLKSLLEPTHINSNTCGTLHSNINHQFIENPRLQTKEEMISALDNLPQDVYRVKGFVRFSDQQHVYLVQYAQGNIELSPIQLKTDVPLYLIVIGKHLKQIQLDL